MGKQRKRVLQWHPAFYAGLQIELQEESAKLSFENEHQLGTKPKEIDVLVIKKEGTEPVQKNIGRIFKRYNIIEYKSPTDYLNIDDFYKVYGYACFYKADTATAGSIRMEEITISFVCSRFPKKLAAYLKKRRGLCINEQESGIYHITGDQLPIQLIVTEELSEQENLWIKGLTNRLQDIALAEKLLEEYGNHKGNGLYRSVMNIIVRANEGTFEEVKMMCEALEELMKDELAAMRIKGLEDGRQEGLKEGLEEGLQEGIKEGIKEGIRALILDNLEEKKSREQIVAKLVKLFSIDESEAQEYYNKYAKSTVS